jgi:hypothetical protein
MKAPALCTLVVVSLFAVCARGQSSAGGDATQPSPAALPAAPAANTLGAVRGEVLYPDQSPLPGARLTLTPANATAGVGTSTSSTALTTTTETDGSFVFQQVPPGAFTLTVTSGDVEPASTSGTVAAAGSVELPPIVMRLAVVHTDVTAVSEHEAAEREVKAEEGQRILKAIPNFMVVYDDEPVALSAGQKFRLSARTLADPVTIGVSAAIAGGEQASNAYPGFGQGLRGYARRFGASVGDSTSGMLLSGAILPTVFHQDPRYFYRGTGSRGSRLMFVLKQTVEQKGDNGRWQFAWSNTLGGVGSALISDTYYPRQGHQWGSETGQLFGLSVLSSGISNLMQEFVFGHITSRR